MKSKKASVVAVAASTWMAVMGFVEPIYTVTTSGEGTNSLDTAMVQVTLGGETSEVAFSDLSLAGGTFRKCGTGWLQSSDAMASFEGELVIEEGAFIVSRTGQSGKINAGNDQYKTEWTGCARVVVSNGATLAIDNATEYPTLKQPISICGDGYKGFGAICNFNGRSGSNGSQLYYSQVTLTGDATICHGCDGGRLGLGYSVLDMNGHTLTSKSLEGRGVHVMGGVQVTNPGHIVFDSTLAHFSLNKKWDGAAANTVTFTNNAYLRMQGFGSDVKWTAINACEPLGADAYDSADTWDKPNANRWNGPFRLDKPMTVGYNARPTHCLSLGGTVSGEAGLAVKDHWLRLRARNNTFKGGVNVGSGGHLVLYGNGSLPANGGTVTVASGGEVLFDDTVATEEACLATMKYPSFDWSVASGETKTFPPMYVTNTVAAGLVKRGDGVLELKGPVSVTGVVELAGGTLRLPFEQAGLCEGWVSTNGPYGRYDNGAKMLGKLECITTNRVALGTELAYTTNMVLWQRSPSVQDWSLLLSYHGYIWNRTGTDATWVFAQSMWKGNYLYIDGERVMGYTRPGVVTGSETEPKNFYYHSGDALSKCVAFYTVTVPPGAHRIDLRTYTQGSGSFSSGAWGPCCIAPTNATWKVKFGWGLDKNGTMSTNCADYAELLDPGDGSLLTVTTNGMDATLAALVPSFARLKFSGGTLDAYGSDVRVPVLEGANGTITNSNAFAANGVVAVGEKWILHGSGYSGGRLMVHGKLKFAEGARFELEDPELLSRRGRYVIAEATGGIHGVPDRILSDGEATHWRLAVGSGESGNDTLELFWSMGFAISFR